MRMGRTRWIIATTKSCSMPTTSGSRCSPVGDACAARSSDGAFRGVVSNPGRSGEHRRTFGLPHLCHSNVVSRSVLVIVSAPQRVSQGRDPFSRSKRGSAMRLSILRRLVLHALPAMCFTSIARGQAHIDFANAVSYALGGKPAGGTLFDFNADGHLDLAVTSKQPNKIEFFANRGDGTFAAPFALLTGNGTGPEGLAAGDFNADGKMDLVVALCGTGQVQVVLADGAGGVALGTSAPVGAEPSMIVAADFDGDGRVDVAVNNRASNDMSVLLNDGS